jgi:hypothetical protein
MKKISQDQINAVIKAFYDLNCPVQLFEGLQKLFKDLPEVEEKKD